MISLAQAAETATDAAMHAPFYTSTSFWTAMAFVIFVAGFGKKIAVIVAGMLDERGTRIKNEIEEVTRLRAEAQDLLVEYQKKQRDAETEAKAIVEYAREEAARIAAEAKEALSAGLERREQLAEERIKQAETKAMDQVRALAVDVAIEATRSILADSLSDTKADKLVDDSIKDLSGKLH